MSSYFKPFIFKVVFTLGVFIFALSPAWASESQEEAATEGALPSPCYESDPCESHQTGHCNSLYCEDEEKDAKKPEKEDGSV